MAKRENGHKNRRERGCIVGQVCCRSNSKAGNVWKKKRKKEKKDGRVGTGGKCVMKEASARSSE